MLEMVFDFKALSYQQMYTNSRNGRRFMNERGKLYIEELGYHLEKYAEELAFMGEFLELPNEAFSLRIFYYCKDFYNKKGDIHQRNGDLDNPDKPLIDEIFKRIGHDDYILKHRDGWNLPAKEDKVVILVDTFRLNNCEYLDWSVAKLQGRCI